MIGQTVVARSASSSVRAASRGMADRSRAAPALSPMTLAINDPRRMPSLATSISGPGGKAMPKVAERFLVEYAVLRSQMRDSNKESTDTSPLLQAIEKEILDAVEELEEDISAIPVIDNTMLNYADEL